MKTSSLSTLASMDSTNAYSPAKFSTHGQACYSSIKSSAAACNHCHRIERKGETLGPDSSRIETKYRRDQLLGHILEPSRFMEPKYVPYVLETSKAWVLSGLLEMKAETEVVIKDAKNKLHRVGAKDVELLVCQQKSIMPELLPRDMTRQQAADLLAYLSSRK